MRSHVSIHLQVGRPTNRWPLFVSIGDATSGEVVWGDLDLNTITGQNSNAVHSHFSGTVCEDLVPIFQLDFEHGIGQRLDHSPFQDNRVFLRLWQVRTPRVYYFERRPKNDRAPKTRSPKARQNRASTRANADTNAICTGFSAKARPPGLRARRAARQRPGEALPPALEALPRRRSGNGQDFRSVIGNGDCVLKVS